MSARPVPIRESSLIFWHFARKVVPWIAALVLYLVVATVIVRWDMARNREPLTDFGADLYAMYTQIFFEPTAALPRAPIARLVFWLTPLLGALLLLRGLLRVGSSVFDAEERHRLWVKIMIDEMKDHIVVCGLGHVGIRVVESLKRLSENVVTIERNKDSAFAAAVERDMGFPVLYGDMRRDELLIEAGIRRAKAVICATDDDLANLEVAIDARRENPKIRVVMRMFDSRVAEKVRAALDVDETFSTSALSGPLVALQATLPGVLGVYRLEDGSMRATIETAAPAGWVGKSVAECEELADGRIVGIRRADETLRPRHDSKIAAGDRVTLDLPADAIGRLRRGAA